MVGVCAWGGGSACVTGETATAAECIFVQLATNSLCRIQCKWSHDVVVTASPTPTQLFVAISKSHRVNKPSHLR